MAWYALTNEKILSTSSRFAARTRPRLLRKSLARLSDARSLGSTKASPARSSLVRRSLRLPSSSSACLTHFRIVRSHGSNSRSDRASRTNCSCNSAEYRFCAVPVVDSFEHPQVSAKPGDSTPLCHDQPMLLGRSLLARQVRIPVAITCPKTKKPAISAMAPPTSMMRYVS